MKKLIFLLSLFICSVSFGQNIHVTTWAAKDSSTKIANTQYVDKAIGAGTPSWDATLTVNPITSQPWNAVQNSAGQFIDFVTPIDYNPATKKDRFSRWMDGNFTNPNGRKDIVGSFWSYNMAAGASVVTANEAAFGFNTETYYQQDGTNLSEFHLPTYVDTTGLAHRLWSTYTHRPTGYSYLQSQVGNLSFRHYWDNAAPEYFNVASGDIEGTHVPSGASMRLSSELSGVGGNVVFTMVDGGGSAYQLIGNGSQELDINSPLLMVLHAGQFLKIPNWVAFGSNDYFSDGNVRFEAPNTTTNKGFDFYSAGLATNLFSVHNSQTVSWQNTAVVGNYIVSGRTTFGSAAAYPVAGAWVQIVASVAGAAQINLAPGVAPTTTINNGDIYNDGTHAYIRIAGAWKQLDN